AVLGGNLQPVNRGVSLDCGFAVRGGDVLVAGLRAFENALLDRERGDDLVPRLRWLGTLEVVGEEQLLLLGDGLLRDGGRLRGWGVDGDQDEGDEQEGSLHGELALRRGGQFVPPSRLYDRFTRRRSRWRC